MEPKLNAVHYQPAYGLSEQYIWSRIWKASLSPNNPLPPINQQFSNKTVAAA
jgi:hypothetical protein